MAVVATILKALFGVLIEVLLEAFNAPDIAVDAQCDTALRKRLERRVREAKGGVHPTG